MLCYGSHCGRSWQANVLCVWKIKTAIVRLNEPPWLALKPAVLAAELVHILAHKQNKWSAHNLFLFSKIGLRQFRALRENYNSQILSERKNKTQTLHEDKRTKTIMADRSLQPETTKYKSPGSSPRSKTIDNSLISTGIYEERILPW